jgi:hypothetical protein
MATQTATSTKPKQDVALAQQVQELREIFADAPEMAKTALERALPTLASLGSGELTVIAPFAPGGAQRLRQVLRLLKGNFSAADKVGTVHDMRFVFLDNDTKFLFATAYDGEWDPYIEDFATKIPDEMDVIFSAFEGWPGIRSPKVKDWIVERQITAEGWFVAHPDLSVAEAGRVKRIGKAVDEFLDKIGD